MCSPCMGPGEKTRMLGDQPHRPLEDSPGSAWTSQPPLPTWVTQGDWQVRRHDPPAGLVHSVCLCVCEGLIWQEARVS